ncbi:DUF397 domain-containing protein [Actinokineospora sp. UTMC 2448]|uniref:DUF397 domain-containing protein n=1 Tax=Actinokineospora sp. UTMC 2448 TaxID=2268449 RepID=UPI002164D53B|nr:DUF397 domain-containing protein [Actinokineospora sp. UTMC 2448]UVS77544.1 hypothetical protein Actkin_01257 [Actinokineospora sp. UTMC 2448]
MNWRKSSRSGNQSDCVELRQDLSAARDSKNPNATLPLTPTAIRNLIAHVR